MSNYSNRDSKMPDTSMRLRSDFSAKQTVVALILVIAIVALCALGFFSLDARRTHDLKVAVASANAEKAKFEELVKQGLARKQDLDQREQALATREAKLKAAETNLAEREQTLALDRAILAQERTDFSAHQNRVYALAKALHIELEHDYEGKTIYIDPSSPDLLIEESEEPLE